MPKVDPVKVLNIDNVPYAVDAMSENVKSMVRVYDEWNQKLVDAQDEVAVRRAALNDLSRTIIVAVREEQEAAKKAQVEAEAKAAAEAAAKAGTPAPVTPTAIQGTKSPAPVVAPAPVASEPDVEVATLDAVAPAAEADVDDGVVVKTGDEDA